MARTSATSCYIAACALTVLFALAHLGGVISTVRSARSDPRLAEAFDHFRAFRFSTGGVASSLWNLRQFFSMAFSVLLIAGMLPGWIVWRSPASVELFVPIAAIQALSMGALLCLALVYRVVPGIVSAAVISFPPR